jgi:hypothetical protein
MRLNRNDELIFWDFASVYGEENGDIFIDPELEDGKIQVGLEGPALSAFVTWMLNSFSEEKESLAGAILDSLSIGDAWITLDNTVCFEVYGDGYHELPADSNWLEEYLK